LDGSVRISPILIAFGKRAALNFLSLGKRISLNPPLSLGERARVRGVPAEHHPV